MTTLTKKNSLVLEHIMALLAKAAYCRKRPTNENSNPEQVNTVDGAVEALKSWLGTDSGWSVYSFEDSLLTSLESVAYRNGNQIVIAYRGTDDIGDKWADFELALHVTNEQCFAGYNFYQAIKSNIEKENPDINFTYTIVGHSLGGYVAQYVAYKDSLTAYTFNAPGYRPLFGYDKNKASRLGFNPTTINKMINKQIKNAA